MKIICTAIFVICSTYLSIGQLLPPKQAYPLDIKQIHSGHSLTDPLFSNWPGQYVNLIGIVNAIPSWQLFDAMVGKSTSPAHPSAIGGKRSPGLVHLMQDII
ncbi:MAG: hypothetical protein IPN89_13355 [Saprospiraceae bacterium]|nr:hypothetical protein [Saprospiraceae bacterium]